MTTEPDGMTAAQFVTMQHEKWFVEIQKADTRLRAWPDGNGRQNLHKPSAAAMRWAIHLADIDLSALSAGDFSNLQFEVACFRRYQMAEPYMPTFVIHGRDRAWNTPPLPEKDEILKIQEWLKQSFQAMLNKDPRARRVTYRAPVQTQELFWWPDIRAAHRGEGRWVYMASTPPEFEQFVVVREFFDLLKEHVYRLDSCRCDDCQKVFLRDRTNQAFCSKRCQWRHAQREVKKISPDRFGKRGRPTGKAKAKEKVSGKGRRERDGTKGQPR